MVVEPGQVNFRVERIVSKNKKNKKTTTKKNKQNPKNGSFLKDQSYRPTVTLLYLYRVLMGQSSVNLLRLDL